MEPFKSFPCPGKVEVQLDEILDISKASDNLPFQQNVHLLPKVCIKHLRVDVHSRCVI